ncbi:VIT-domain-containing protein [Exidia glandulosa HHB12029]|uniref:VIT-domain-containing protein n=1 Tax=Exidia glandulosa HHB12029 TaxID=1314781 RepID=A0A165QJ51_EXIGL|nr:VIT-domain-containing protein [Exidia glandulosa HHB12029]
MNGDGASFGFAADAHSLYKAQADRCGTRVTKCSYTMYQPHNSRLSGILPLRARTTANEYPLIKAACHYTVVDVNMHAQLTQTYVSSAKVPQEVKYVFPLPSNAAICAFNAVVDDKRTIHGVVKQKQEAKREYDQAVAKGKTAGLLDQHTADVFQVSLGNLQPGQKIAINISFVSIVSHDGKLDTLRLTFPLSIAPNYGAPPPSLAQSFDSIRGTAPAVEFSVSFAMTSNITSVVSHTHPIALSLGTLFADSGAAFDPTQAHVSLNTSAMLDKDIVVVLKTDRLDYPRCVVERSSRQGSASDAIALTLVPRFNVPPLPAQEYIFLVDRSGSMGGGRIAAVCTALQIMLRSLPSRGTTFNIFSFGSHCDSLWPTSVEYGSESVERAGGHVDQMRADYGGTEIRAALVNVFASRSTSDHVTPSIVILLTDGGAWDLNGVLEVTADAISEAQGSLRVFVLGIGDQVSTNMCDGIARAGRGVATYATENEKLDAKLVNLLRAARGGPVNDVEVDWGVPTASSSEEFELIDAEETGTHQEITPSLAVPVSLFDASDVRPEPDVALGPQDIPVDLPPVPQIQQSDTAKLGLLYPNFRTSLFAIVQQPSLDALLPEKVIVRGKAMGTPVALEVPIVRTDTHSIDFVHVLAARALVQQYEDALIKTALIKAQIARLATTYSIASSQTSFVAVDEEGEGNPDNLRDGSDVPAGTEQTEDEYLASERERRRARRLLEEEEEAAYIREFSRQQYGYEHDPPHADSGSTRRGLQRERASSVDSEQGQAIIYDDDAAYEYEENIGRQRRRRAARASSPLEVTLHFDANRDPAYEDDDEGGRSPSASPEYMSSAGSESFEDMVRPVRHDAGEDDLVPSLQHRLAAFHYGPDNDSSSIRSRHSARSRSMSPLSVTMGRSPPSLPNSASPDLSSPRSRLTAIVQDRAVHDVSPIVHIYHCEEPYSTLPDDAELVYGPGINHIAIGPTVTVDMSTPSVEAFARCQRFDGCFAPTETLCVLLGLSDIMIQSSRPDTLENDTVWSTVLAIAYLQDKFANQYEAWSLLVEKARDFVVSSLVEDKGVPESAALGMLDQWIGTATSVLSVD